MISHSHVYPSSLAKIKETRRNSKSKNISCDVDLTNDDLQNEDYLYIQTSNSETGLGVFDHVSAKEADRNVSNKREKYIQYLTIQRYEIGKYVSEYSAASTLQKYKAEFPQLNESTVRPMWLFEDAGEQSVEASTSQSP